MDGIFEIGRNWIHILLYYFYEYWDTGYGKIHISIKSQRIKCNSMIIKNWKGKIECNLFKSVGKEKIFHRL